MLRKIAGRMLQLHSCRCKTDQYKDTTFILAPFRYRLKLLKVLCLPPKAVQVRSGRIFACRHHLFSSVSVSACSARRGGQGRSAGRRSQSRAAAGVVHTMSSRW